MQIDPTRYKIDNIHIEWGKTLDEVRPLLDNFEKFTPSNSSRTYIRCKCDEIFGLKTTECEIQAPFTDRPVMQVKYELLPVEPDFWESPHAPYLKQLKKVLGKPTKRGRRYNQPDLKNEYISSAVVFWATWQFEDIKISLSVYGGIRNNESGPSAACIFLDWMNVLKAAKSYREKNARFENVLFEIFGNELPIIYKLDYQQSPFGITHEELMDSKKREVRHFELALYKRNLMQTPKTIQTKLEKNEIAYYYNKQSGITLISNKWDTIYLSPNDKNEIVLNKLMPARGPGGWKLEIKELTIEDSKNSNSLPMLVQQIENDTSIKVQQCEKYDVW